MRCLFKTGLIMAVSLAWAVSPAKAQSGYGSPTLLPLPNASPAPPEFVPISYNDPSPSDSFGSAFTSRKLEPTPAGAGAQPATSFADAVHQQCWDECPTCNQCCGGGWFGAIGGIAMGRNRPNPYWTTYETNNNPNQLLNTQNAGANWAGGGEVTVGKMWCGCCAPYGVAFTYWQLAPMQGNSSIRDTANELSTPIDLGNVFFGATPAGSFFDNAREHRITRDDRVLNLELNFLQGLAVDTGRFQLIGLAGFRYFRFDEQVVFGSVAGGFEFGDNGGANEAYFNNQVVNNLYGGQVGAIGNWMWTDRLGIFFIPKVGIYGNQMNGRTQLYTGDGIYANVTNGASVFDIYAHKTDVSFIGELDFGFNYAITPSLRAYLGYRVLGVTGLALSDNQFLPFMADSAGFAQVKQNGDLILHGFMGGLGWMF